MNEFLTRAQRRAWIDVCKVRGDYGRNPMYHQDYWQCRKDAEAGSERAKQYLAAFAAELLKG